MNISQIENVEKAHQSLISCLNFNPINDNLLASSSDDRYVKLWRVNEENKIREDYEYKVHVNGINQVKWNCDGNLLASAGNDCAVNVLDVNTLKINRNFRLESCVTCLNFNYASNLLLLGTYDNQIVLFDMRAKNLITHLLAHSEPITSVSFSQDSTVLISASYDGFCRLWDTFKGNCLKTIVFEKSPQINKVSFLADMNHLMISTLNNQIQVMDLFKEEEVIKYTGHKNETYLIEQTLVENEDDTYLISGSEDGCLYVWNVESGGPGLKFKIDENNSIINCLSSNKKGILATASFPISTNIQLFNINF